MRAQITRIFFGLDVRTWAQAYMCPRLHKQRNTREINALILNKIAFIYYYENKQQRGRNVRREREHNR